jgi:integrase
VRGSIQHRPDRPAPWRARYLGPDGRQRSRSFDRRIDAERWLRTQLAKLDRGEWVDPDYGQIEWAEYSAQLIAGRTHLAARTQETDRRCHERAAQLIGDVPLTRLTPELLRRIMAELTAAGYAPETVAKTMRWVRLTLNQAVRDRRLLSSPAQGVRLPTPRRTQMRLLDPTEVEALAAALPGRYASLPVVAAYTGLRWGELAGLRVANIDTLRRRLTVSAALVEASGQQPRLATPKSSTSERTIALPNVAIHALARHLDEHPPTDGMVWTTERGGLLRRGTFGRIWRRAVEDTVGPPCRLHDLRHTHASWLIAAGEHPKVIQTRLGHSSIQVTMDRYGHLMDGLDHQTAQRLDAIAAASRDPAVAPAALTVGRRRQITPLGRGLS